MKPHHFLSSFTLLLICLACLAACGSKKYPQYSVTLTYSDGSSDSYDMVAGSMLLVHQGDQQYVAKASDGADKTLELDVKSYAMSQDTMRKERTIKKMGSSTARLAVNKSEMLGGTGNVQVKVTQVSMMDSGKPRPQGACKGICCEAKCFSTFCCGDEFECKNAPCNCAPPSNCPGQGTTPNPAIMFQLFKSGDETFVLKAIE